MSALLHLFAARVKRHPSRPALSPGPGRRWISFRDLDRRAARLGRRLAGAGLKRGEIAAIQIGNNPRFFTSVLAVWSLGGVILPMDEHLPSSAQADLIRAFRPRLLLEPAERGLKITARGPAVGLLRPRGISLIRLTSGTTGRPRGAGVSAAQLIADGRAIISKMGIRPGDLNLAAIPLNHSYGFDNILIPLLLQGTPALLLRRPLPALILRALRSRRPTVLPAVPYLLDLLARHPEPPLRSGLRLCISAGAPLPPATARRFQERFGVPVRNFYGSSETGGITCEESTTEPAEGSVGTPLPGVRIRIDRRGLGDLPAGTGRVVVSGPAVGTGYLPEPSPDLRNGRFRTQDLGRLDEAGRLRVVGRISGLVNVSGRNVNPAEVEGALLALEEVRDAAVLGVSDSLRGERLEAWVVSRGKEGPDRIRSALCDRLAGYKVPRRIHAVSKIPRTARGKIDRLRLLRRR